jgi:retron-type reverse transcriptase
MDECYFISQLLAVAKGDNLLATAKRIIGDKGTAGMDGMTVDEMSPYLEKHGDELSGRILDGKYRPRPALRVEAPKPGGGVRLLGIPTVIDRTGRRGRRSPRF